MQVHPASRTLLEALIVHAFAQKTQVMKQPLLSWISMLWIRFVGAVCDLVSVVVQKQRSGCIHTVRCVVLSICGIDGKSIAKSAFVDSNCECSSTLQIMVQL